MNNSVIRLLALSTMNLIAVCALANEANIQASKQVGIQASNGNSLIKRSRQYTCISSQYTCISSRGGHENLDSAKDNFQDSL